MEFNEATYIVALEGVSIWCLRQTVKAILQGGLGHKWFPGPVEFRMKCDEIMQPVKMALTQEAREARQRDERAREAPPYVSPDEHRRVMNLIAATRRERESRKAAERAPELVISDEERDDRLRRILALKDRPGITQEEIATRGVVERRLNQEETP